MKNTALRLTVPERAGETRKRVAIGYLLACLVCLVLLLALKDASDGWKALLNRVYTASEAVNSYRYERFAVSEAQDVRLASALLGLLIASLSGYLIASRRSWAALLCALLLALGQAYIGLSLPSWVNLLLFSGLGLLCLSGANARSATACLLVALLTGILVISIWPQTNQRLEDASERARDWLSSTAIALSGQSATISENAAHETRHVRALSLETGDDDAQEERSYRLVTVEEAQISKPRWIDYLRIFLLLLLAIALVVLPFLPFLFLNARRQKARETRAAFDAADRSEAACALFRHVAAYLEATGCGGGNALYRAWPERIRERLPEEYVERFTACGRTFERAAYSDHEITEQELQEMRILLEETEALLYEQADRRQRWRLRYVACLHE